MLELKAAAFYEAARLLQHTLTFVSAKGATLKKNEKLAEKTHAIFRDGSKNLRPALIALGAKITLMALDDFDSDLAGSPTWESVNRRTQDVNRTLRRELTQAKLVVLSDQERLWFDPPAPLFGDRFEARFQTKGAFELDEAAKCLALGRPTAAVFHLMRLLEVGIQALAACLGIPDPIKPAERNWSIMLDKVMDDGIKAKWPTAAARMRPNCKVFEELHASLDAVKNPLRNATMHVENKYTDAEADHIFALVKGFMMKLADRMDENGHPRV
jgi:hypothetical protein